MVFVCVYVPTCLNVLLFAFLNSLFMVLGSGKKNLKAPQVFSTYAHTFETGVITGIDRIISTEIHPQITGNCLQNILFVFVEVHGTQKQLHLWPLSTFNRLLQGLTAVVPHCSLPCLPKSFRYEQLHQYILLHLLSCQDQPVLHDIHRIVSWSTVFYKFYEYLRCKLSTCYVERDSSVFKRICSIYWSKTPSGINDILAYTSPLCLFLSPCKTSVSLLRVFLFHLLSVGLSRLALTA